MAPDADVMPNAERDDESGKYTSTYPREAFVDAVRAADGFAGTQDVADAVGCSYELAYKRLRALADGGDVESQKVANARVWLATDDENARESRESGAQSDSTADSLAAVDFPDTRDREACVRAVHAAAAFIRERDGATRKEIVRAVMPEHPLGYDVSAALDKLDSPDRYRGGWWRNVIKPGLKALDDVEKPKRGASVWSVVGDTDA